MAEAVLLALTKIGSVLADETAKKMLSKLSEKVNNLKDLNDKIELIRMHLTAMNNVIRKIGTVYLTDEVVKGWIGEEEWFLKKYFIKASHYVLVFSQIAEEVIKIEKEIKKVIELKDLWFQPSQLVADQLIEMERQRSRDNFPLLIKDEDLVGIEDNRRKLTEYLYSDELDSTVITVSGMGGLGKTTLVTNVYEREKINFPATAWMVVSQTYTIEALLRKLLMKVGREEQVPPNIDKLDVHDLKEKIKQKLENKKCLIVLDDVWDQEVYLQMSDAFQNLQSSRIIITTRKNHVAALAQPTRRLDVQPLRNTQAFDLFCRRTFYNKEGHACPSDLVEVATSIVDRCQGLPLAIVSIASLLSSRAQTYYIWNQIYNQLRSELSKNDHVRAVLNLSYHDLSGDLRSCFLYCSLFPEDYPIPRESLIRLWVAEGFALSKENNTAEEVAEGNLMELIHRNMLVVLENDEQGRVSTCTMHDIVRDLALAVAKEARFGTANNYGAMILMGKDKDVRRLSSYGWKDSASLEVKLPRLRTLVSLGTISSSPNMLLSILSESSYLTVLELQDSEITEVPVSIGNLFNLRYIGLRRTKVRSLPDSVEKLLNLQTLDIKQTKIEKLPRGISKVKKLRHLLADRYADEKQSQFRLSNMPLLSNLLLSAKDENEPLCFEALKPRSTGLHRLIIRGQWAKGTLQCPLFRGHGRHLKYLALSWCHLSEDPLEMLAPQLPNLTNLRLNNMRSANTLVLPPGSFPHLKLLVLMHMPNVKKLVIGKGALPCIEGLYIVSLAELDKVPQGIESLRTLKKLSLVNLHRGFLTEWNKSGMHDKMQHVLEIRV
ncbi:unnamed protein product [Miscanthus lutarioriparius]|uniref:Uncharacterized protein n=1 Tax=Miscanthus lutarioriparius TaxID=422564 RepID=A0A811Q9U6_9POAL|nr:unnamed protein product [Miscanthus lutarioriparius]